MKLLRFYPLCHDTEDNLGKDRMVTAHPWNLDGSFLDVCVSVCVLFVYVYIEICRSVWCTYAYSYACVHVCIFLYTWTVCMYMYANISVSFLLITGKNLRKFTSMSIDWECFTLRVHISRPVLCGLQSFFRVFTVWCLSKRQMWLLYLSVETQLQINHLLANLNWRRTGDSWSEYPVWTSNGGSSIWAVLWWCQYMDIAGLNHLLDTLTWQWILIDKSHTKC